MKLNQSKERKNSTDRYCPRHKIHYKKECVGCEVEKGNYLKLIKEEK
jgi:hypothetical protein